MSHLFVPNADGPFGFDWSTTGASFFTEVDDDPQIPATDDDYVSIAQAAPASDAAGRGTFRWPFPSYFTTTIDYGDGTSGSNFAISAVRYIITARRLGANTVMQFVVDSGPIENTAFTVNNASYQDYILTSVNDPNTGRPWTVSGLAAARFGVGKLAIHAGSGSEVRVTRVRLETEETEYVPTARHRLAPRRGEPVINCVECGQPFHISDMVKPTDPMHHQYDKYVCEKDFDIDTNVEKERLRGTSLKEGDIWFDV
jgi:hypothetical protein